ncbi:unnamed protein product [Didymodactylos carnosus]|uniref:EamA domain-containing protein n=1 Tax=Didymodactylos carnosus TaxID=1234261 RepID=A0A816CJR9_9BILA|nr:unnamed protein product [Didymodactylos carnosus]CAF1624310.1 unnamed protein product [Didymodactylos carnosus]CAF4272432.1 unnamed protein product [Didymodactylos carnosus]CAF4517075.1 unnamed protein product [Didymodactylos carnosus]
MKTLSIDTRETENIGDLKTLETNSIDDTQQPNIVVADIPLLVDPLEDQTIKKSSNINSYLGFIYSLLAAFILTLAVFITKVVKIDLLDAVLLRLIVQSIISFFYIYSKKYVIFAGTPKQKVLQIINCLLAVFSLIIFLLANRYLPLPDLTTIRYTQVIWTAIAGIIIFREKPSIPLILGSIFTVIGVTLVAQPHFLFKYTQRRVILNTTIDDYNSTMITKNSTLSNHFLGILLALSCSIILTLLIITNKTLLVYKIKPSVLLIHFTSTSLIFLTVYQLYKYYVSHNFTIRFTWQYIVASLALLLHILSSLLIQKAIKREHPGIFAITQSSEILFAIMLQNLFTQFKSNLFVLLGSALVLTSILLVGGYKFYKDKRKR